jgi:hypothetical protein
MSTSRTGRCSWGAEEDGGDLADQPHQPTGGEQQHRRHQPERIRDVLLLAVGVAVGSANDTLTSSEDPKTRGREPIW